MYCSVNFLRYLWFPAIFPSFSNPGLLLYASIKEGLSLLARNGYVETVPAVFH